MMQDPSEQGKQGRPSETASDTAMVSLGPVTLSGDIKRRDLCDLRFIAVVPNIFGTRDPFRGR